MGRRAKYLTAEAKRTAKYAQIQVYRKTEKGREARRRENHRRDNKRGVRTLTWVGVVVPQELFARSQKVLRASFAVHDSGPLLGLWTAPYDFAMPDISWLSTHEGVDHTSASLWSSFAAVLGAYQYSEVIEAGWERFERWSADDLVLDEVEEKVKQEVATRVAAWVHLAGTVRDGQDGEVMSVGLDWGGKIIRMLVEEWEIRKEKGVAGYRESRRSSSLPWQKMMRDTMCMFNQEAS